ncbi:MAG: hypothetical protein ACJ76J_12160 [Thermoanaerobaculia bacterium]
MKSKPVQWLVAAALLLTIAAPGWAQPELVGGEFKVNQVDDARQVNPQVAFGPSGSSLIVWENSIRGILGRGFDKDGNPTTGEMVLAGNDNLPGIPARGNVIVRKEPALIYLPSGEFLVFWTEEKDFLSLDYFYEQREILEQDVYGQRFTAQGTPAGERFRVNASAVHFQRRPKAALHPAGIVVVWEQAPKQNERDSTAVYGRLLTRRGTPTGSELRIDAAESREVWHLAVAANTAGQFVVTWEGDKADDPNILARIYDRDGDALGSPFLANSSVPGRQRRPAAVATRDGDFLIAWQSSLRGTEIRSTMGQLFSPAGARIGREIEMSRGNVGHLHTCPALALLPSGNVVVTWIDWAGTFPDGIYARLLDSDGNPLESAVLISEERIFPQYLISVATNAQGDIVATWESRITRERAIAARRLKAD